MLLSDLIAKVTAYYAKPAPITLHGNDHIIISITQDSRHVVQHSLFAAIQGTAHNGEAYIEQAITAGATAILCDAASLAHLKIPKNIAVLTSDNPRKALSQCAAMMHRHQIQHCVAITGTDGKTSVAELTRQLWQAATIPAASIGTLGLRSDQALQHMPTLSDNTSPEAVRFYHTLSLLEEQHVHHVAVEASSHGLHQSRLHGLIPDVAIFTSFSQDHLDYHATMEAYFAAKMILFHELLRKHGRAVIYADDARLNQFAAALRTDYEVITYGTDASADLRIESITPMQKGQHISFYYQGIHYEFNLPLYGTFQVYNTIAAMLAVEATSSMHLAEIIPLCASLTTVKGRLELIRTKNNALIFIDYAHTAGALEKALLTLRPYASGTLHLVFGCGGDRDTTKRPQMGAVAEALADSVIITDDNPRTEAPEPIRAAIAAACPKATIIADRRSAIHKAMQQLLSGDVLLVAGKGHENYQIIGTTKHHFDDAEVIREAA
jgi:UDP-N-acetylmuramoyl-L-alanyl-D-glutamate--2,6-diaminopimelate ligase